MTRSTREIERDVERTRSDIEDTVEALRDKMSIGQIVDEAAHYFRDSGGTEVLNNFAAQARANPMPLALVGIGLAWLMSGRGQPAMRSYSSYRGSYAGNGGSAYGGSSYGGSSYGGSQSGIGARVGETAGAARDALSGTGRKAGEAVASSMHKVGDSASQAYGKVSDTASQAYGKVSDTASQAYGAVSDTASQAYERVSDTASHTYDQVSRRAGQVQRTVADLIEDEPLILAGLGLAVGAAIGAMMPATRTEQELMGDKLDELKEGASEMAREEWNKAKSVARDAASAAMSEVEKGGANAQTAERAAKSASRTAEQSASDKGLGSSPRKS